MSNPFFKLLIFVNFSVLAIFGEFISIILAIIFCLFFIFISRKKEEFIYLSIPYLLIILFILILVSIPGGSKEDIINTLITASRLVLIIVSAIFFFLYTNIVEIIFMVKKLGFSPYLGYSIGVGFRYIPITIEDSYRVILAQKSRGLKFSIFKYRTYKLVIKSLAIPIINAILRRIYINLISMKMRRVSPRDNMTSVKYKTNFKDFLLLFISILLWIFSLKIV